MFRPDYGSSQNRHKKVDEAVQKNKLKKYSFQKIRLPIIRYNKKLSLYGQKERSDEFSSQFDDTKFQEQELLSNRENKQDQFIEKQNQLIYYRNDQYVKQKNDFQTRIGLPVRKQKGLAATLDRDPYRMNLWTKNWFNIIFYVSKFIRSLKKSSTFLVKKEREIILPIFTGDLYTFQQKKQLYSTKQHQKDNKEFIQKIKKQTMLQESSSFKNIKNKYASQNKVLYQKWNQTIRMSLYNQIVVSLKTIFYELDKLFPVLSLDNKVLSIWDFLVFISQVIAIFQAPFVVGFIDIDEKDQISKAQIQQHSVFSIKTIYLINFIFFCADVFVSLNTSYYFKGMEIKQRFQIMSHYVKNFLVSDVILIINQLLIINNDFHYIYLLDILRVIRVNRLIGKFNYSFNTSETKDGCFQIFNIFLKIIYTCHLLACANYFMCMMQVKKGIKNNWIETYKLMELDLTDRYIHTLDYMIMTSITAGILTPNTRYDHLMSIVTCLILATAFAYLMSSIGLVVQEMQTSQSILRKKMREINYYLVKRNISSDLTNRIKRHYEFLHEEQYQGYQKGNFVLDDLSQKLYMELQNEKFEQYLREEPIFRNHFSDEIISKIPQYMTEISASPDQIIFDKDNQSNDLYFVINGKVQLFIGNSSSQSNYRIVDKLNFFNEFQFFSGIDEPNIGVKSIGSTYLACIPRDDFLRLVQQFPKDYENFCFIKDKLLSNSKNYELFQSQCYICTGTSHQSQNCSQIAYDAN